MQHMREIIEINQELENELKHHSPCKYHSLRELANLYSCAVTPMLPTWQAITGTSNMFLANRALKVFLDFFIRIGTNPDIITNVVESLEARREKRRKKRARKARGADTQEETDASADNKAKPAVKTKPE